MNAPATDLLRHWRMRVFAATWLCYAGYYFGRRPWYVAKSAIGRDLGFDAATLGAVGALYLVAYAVAQFAAGAAGARFGPRVLLLGGMAASVVANVGFGTSSASLAFFALMALNGVAQATGWSATVGTMAAWFNRQERGAVMGWWTTNFQVGGVVANALAGFVLEHHGWRAALLSGAAALGAAWLVTWRYQRNAPDAVGLPPVLDADGSPVAREDTPGWDRDAIINVALIGLFYFCVKLIRYALWSWAPFFLARNHGLQGDDASYVATLFDVCGIPGVVLTGWASDRYFGSRRAGVSLAMTLVLLASCLGLYVAGSASVTLFAVGIAVCGFSLYGPDALLSAAGAMDIGSRRGAVLAAGIISGIGSLGPIVQELVIGRMYDARGGDLGPVFLLLVASATIAAGLLAVAVVRNRMGCRPL
jgi:sugar phosphate permease